MMPKIEYSIVDFSPHLFWHVDKKKLNRKKKSQIVKWVLEYGLLKDWKLIQQQYGVGQIALSFIASLASMPPASFGGYILKQSIPQHLNFKGN